MSDRFPTSDPQARLHEEFARIARRSATQIEGEVLGFLAGHSSTSTRARWLDASLPEALVHLALALNGGGLSTLFVSPLERECEARQLRLGTRAPLLSLRQAVRRAAGVRGFTAWCAPNELNGSLVTRVFGPSGPHVVMVEHADATSGLSGQLRPSLSRLGPLLQRFGRSRILASAPFSQLPLRQNVAAQWGIPELGEAENYWGETSLLLDSGLRLQIESRVREDDQEWLARVTSLPRPAVVLCSTPAEVDRIFGLLSEAGVPVHRFHSALPPLQRATELMHFSLPGRRAVLVATSGFAAASGFSGEERGPLPADFGPGYTRQDLRSLVHFTAPGSLRQYAQELNWLASPGSHARAAEWSDAEDDAPEDPPASPRSETGALPTPASPHPHAAPHSTDSLQSTAPLSLVLHADADWLAHRELLERRRPEPSIVETVARAFFDGHRGSSKCGSHSLQDLAELCHCSLQEMQRLIPFLLDAGILKDIPGGPDGGTLEPALGPAEAPARITELLRELEHLRQSDEGRLVGVRAWLEGTSCRRDALVNALMKDANRGAEAATVECGVCDHCAESRGVATPLPRPADNGSEHTPAKKIAEKAAEVDKAAGAPRPPLRALDAQPGESTSSASTRRIPSTRRKPRAIQDAPARPGLAKARHK